MPVCSTYSTLFYSYFKLNPTPSVEPKYPELRRIREEMPLTSRAIGFSLLGLANMTYGTWAYFLNLGFFVML